MNLVFIFSFGMLNFTGQTKKRVVNLGNKKNANANYLERTRLQREQRELHRKEEKACILLQSYIRRYLSLLRWNDSIQGDWVKECGSWSSEEEWVRWLMAFVNLCKTAVTRARLDANLEITSTLGRGIEGNRRSGKFGIPARVYARLVLSMTVLARDLNKIGAPRGEKNVEELVSCLHKLVSDRVGDADYSGVIAELGVCLLKFELDSERSRQVLQLVSHLYSSQCAPEFLEFVSNPKIFEIAPEDGYCELLAVLKRIPYERLSSVSELSDQRKVSLLANFMKIRGDADFTAEDYNIIASILATVTFTVYDVPSNDTSASDIEDLETSKTAKRKYIPVQPEVMNELKKLYSSSFIKLAVKHFTDNNSSISGLVLYIFATLTYFIPSYKSKLCMLITITPGSYGWLYDQLKNDQVYKLIEAKIDEGYDFLRSHELLNIYSSITDSSISRFWKALYTFQEFYSYWLIVSNDFESFSDDKLSLDKVTHYLKFLKCICLTFAFNKENENSIPDFEKLKDISISLLNQLYAKNLRLKFLSDEFWKINTLKFNLDTVLQLIVDEEERRIEMAYDSLDNEGLGNSSRSGFNFQSNGRKKSNNDAQSKLEILKKMPFFIPFEDRVKVFQALIQIDRERYVPNNIFQTPMRLSADIRRESLFEDAFNNFHKCGLDFKFPLNVTLFNEQGGQEAGIDGGGITKEFLTSVVFEGFDPYDKYKFFKENESHQLYPNDDIQKKLSHNIDVEEQRMNLLYIQFLGSVIGKCLYENVLIDISFAPFFLNKWVSHNGVYRGMKNSINDLSYLDEQLFNNLIKLTNMSDEELKALDLNFTIDEIIGGKKYTEDLMPPNGEQIQVASNNRLNYIHQISNYKLNKLMYVQTKYFLSGLYEIISSNWLSMFDSYELQMLISGGESDVNIQDWKQNVEYGGYFDDDITIIYFWEVICEMSAEERFKLLKFVTSVSRAPLLGFSSLYPKFGIRNAGRYLDRLPTASTCVNLLKLPDYQDKEVMRSKLLYAINTEARFELS